MTENKILMEQMAETAELIDRGGHHFAKLLHECGKPGSIAKKNKGFRQFAQIEKMAGSRMVPEDLKLNILVIENNISEFLKFKDIVQPNFLWNHLKNANWYIRDGEFEEWERQLRNHKSYTNNDKIEGIKKIVFKKKKIETASFEKDICYADIDLIIQDIYLAYDTETPLGYNLTQHYFELMPQAIVFLMTSLDVDYLAATGIVHRADRVISKHRMGCFWWYYYQAFVSLYGRMFWKPWCKAGENPVTSGTESDRLYCKKYMRKFFGCIRKWIMEPEILWHGQDVQEMIDHSQKHILDIWRLTDLIIGTAIEKSPKFDKKFNFEDRILLALGIWLHDVGHRGDKYNKDPILIRDAHGSISERLLLTEPSAFGLEWLEDLCTENCETQNGSSEKNHIGERNSTTGVICPIRKLGLICRAHQSSAPLWPVLLPKMYENVKFPGGYGRFGIIENDKMNSEQSLEAWFDSNEDLEWIGSDIRCIADFQDHEGLINVICLLRWLDALDQSRARTGSGIRQKTHKHFLDERRNYCERRLKEIKYLLESSPPGSRTYLTILDEQLQLMNYKKLLDVQDVHVWRHDAVDLISVESSRSSGNLNIEITYDIFPKEPNDKIRLPLEKQYKEIRKDWDSSEWNELDETDRFWPAHIFDDVILSEVKSQIEKVEDQNKNNFHESLIIKFFQPISIQYFFRHKGKKKYKLWPLNKRET